MRNVLALQFGVFCEIFQFIIRAKWRLGCHFPIDILDIQMRVNLIMILIAKQLYKQIDGHSSIQLFLMLSTHDAPLVLCQV